MNKITTYLKPSLTRLLSAATSRKELQILLDSATVSFSKASPATRRKWYKRAEARLAALNGGKL